MNTTVINKKTQTLTFGNAIDFMVSAIAEIISSMFNGKFYFSEEDNFKKVAGWQYLFVKDGELWYHEDKHMGELHFDFDAKVQYINHYDYKYLLDLVWAEAHGKTTSKYAKACGY